VRTLEDEEKNRFIREDMENPITTYFSPHLSLAIWSIGLGRGGEEGWQKTAMSLFMSFN
jgi:hypothetical protein